MHIDSTLKLLPEDLILIFISICTSTFVIKVMKAQILQTEVFPFSSFSPQCLHNIHRHDDGTQKEKF